MYMDYLPGEDLHIAISIAYHTLRTEHRERYPVKTSILLNPLLCYQPLLLPIPALHKRARVLTTEVAVDLKKKS